MHDSPLEKTILASCMLENKQAVDTATMILDEVPSLTKEDLRFKLHSWQFFIFSWFVDVRIKKESDERLVHAVIFNINNSTKIVEVKTAQS